MYGSSCMFRHYIAYRVLVGKPEGKRPPGKPRHRQKHNIKMDTQEVKKWDWSMDRIDLSQDTDG
jgi:hypothetical protein